MPYAVLALLLLALIVLPQVWVRQVMRRHAGVRHDFPGTGGELARHLLDRAGLQTVRVELLRRPLGDHYDPAARAVRLSQDNFEGRSITAVAVAAHEVGHALQHAEGYRPLALRTRLAKSAQAVETIGSFLLVASPLLILATHNPALTLVIAGSGLAVLSLGVALHLVTLPVEFDASFGRALPILRHGLYLGQEDLPAARRVLRAAALTYVAGALIGLLNVARWLRLVRL
jgi:Zn-dependent membrane protease YugP